MTRLLTRSCGRAIFFCPPSTDVDRGMLRMQEFFSTWVEMEYQVLMFAFFWKKKSLKRAPRSVASNFLKKPSNLSKLNSDTRILWSITTLVWITVGKKKNYIDVMLPVVSFPRCTLSFAAWRDQAAACSQTKAMLTAVPSSANLIDSKCLSTVNCVRNFLSGVGLCHII